ncbi:MAG: thiamine diphosphokinase [Lachnospiraceae bacterium]
MEPVCHIVGAGQFGPKDLELIMSRSTKDYLIAADGGLCHLLNAHVIPDLFIGDVDSCNEDLLLQLPESAPCIRLNPMKDHTDIHAAVMQGIGAGYTAFHLYGATGGRTDHTLANIQLMMGLTKDEILVKMFGETEIYRVIVNSSLTLSPRDFGYVSVLALSDVASGVTIQNLKYPLEDATLTNTFALGVSNEFIGKDQPDALIEVKSGTLLVIFPRT